MSKTVICGANAYEKKYYLNPEFSMLPDSVKDELHIMAVLFTEEVGGIFTIGFNEDGELILETDAKEDDILYDEIGSGLLVRKLQRERKELFESLELYYQVMTGNAFL
ncbi:MAG: DUF6145 family protein [Lachnospiraceae bacterium]|nr:DUF6145 family protein [Lachnospiraceae bacterium]